MRQRQLHRQGRQHRPGDRLGDINIDKTAPTITRQPRPAANANGWNNTDVTVSFTGDRRPVRAVDTCDRRRHVSREGAGQSATRHGAPTWPATPPRRPLASINIDKTAPTVDRHAWPGRQRQRLEQHRRHGHLRRDRRAVRRSPPATPPTVLTTEGPAVCVGQLHRPGRQHRPGDRHRRSTSTRRRRRSRASRRPPPTPTAGTTRT